MTEGEVDTLTDKSSISSTLMMSDITSSIKKSVFTPNLAHKSAILRLEQFTEVLFFTTLNIKLHQLLVSIPAMYKDYEWKSVYMSTKHGTSLSQLLRRAGRFSPFILLIKDENGFAFGVYGNEAVRDISEHDKFYGSGECFMFTFRVSILHL